MRAPKMVATLAILLSLSTLFLSGCLSTQYLSTGNDVEVRLDGRREGETLLRHVDIHVNRHHFLFGTIPNRKTIDVAKEVELKPGEALVNAKIDAGMATGVGIGWAFAGIFTFGIVWAVWIPHTTYITGDVVALGEEPAAAPDKATAARSHVTAAEEKAEAAVADAAEPVAAANFHDLSGEYTQADAASACASHGATLPTRKQLKKALREKVLTGAGDVWTSDSDGDEAWTFNIESGATFLKDRSERLGISCFAKGD